MSEPNGDPTDPDRLPDGLRERLDALEESELRAVQSYVERRLDSLSTPLEEAIAADTAGEVIDIEDHGAYALVRLHPPNPDGPGANTDVVSLYHVRQERQLDGEERLDWSYQGDVRGPDRLRCGNCGRTLEEAVDVCPRCGSENVVRGEDG